MNIETMESLFFEKFQLPYRVTIGLLLGIVTLPGFVAVEKFREKQIEKNELAKKQGGKPTLYRHQSSTFMLFYGYAFNYLILTFAFAGGMSRPYLLATAWLCFGPYNVITRLTKTRFFSLVTSKYLFGVRGCIVAGGICGSLYKTLEVETQSPVRELRFLSLCCFAFAAWFSCGIGSVGAWAAHPEYGEFAQEKKLMLLLMQVYFIAGFILQLVATSFVKVEV